MERKVGELTWFERMTKEFENDPEYLREYISLCSDEIKCQEEKIATLERERDELTERLQKLAAEIAEPTIKELDILYRIRKAIGDNGKMMQDELVDHIAGLSKKIKGDVAIQEALEWSAKCGRLEAKLHHVDELLARRPALDSLNGRYEKIEHAINTAKKADKLEAENAELKKAHNFWRDQCASFEEQLFGKIQDNTLTRKRLKKL